MGLTVAGVKYMTVYGAKVQVVYYPFLPLLCRMPISFRERRPSGSVAGLRMGQARLQGLLMDGLPDLQGTLG